MWCKNCKNFKPRVNLEASKELSFDKKSISGECKITKSSCSSDNKCDCNSFCSIE